MKTKTLPTRKEVDKKYTWSVEDLFENDELMQAEYDRLMGQISEFGKYKGRLSESAGTLLEAVRFFEDYSRKIEMTGLYSMLRQSEDLTNSFYNGLSDQFATLYTKAGEAYSFFNPEILETSGIQEEGEGCLSCPGEFGVTRRPKSVKVKARDRNGKLFTAEGEDITARAFCHEIDHLDGILFKTHVIRPLDEN